MIKYISFAAIATLINLLLQYLCLLIYQKNFSLHIAILTGTFGGLIVKYVLDKKYIFTHFTKDKKDDARKFLLYSFFGIFTTLLFWTTEIMFDAIIRTEWAKYAGAVFGLSCGYTIKYFLDKKYVFIKGTQ